MVPAGATLPVDGATLIDCSVGLTKKPRQPASKASSERAAKVAKRRSFRLKEGMIKDSGRRTFRCDVRWKWLPRIVAEKVLAGTNRCTSVCTKVSGHLKLLSSHCRHPMPGAPAGEIPAISLPAGLLI